MKRFLVRLKDRSLFLVVAQSADDVTWACRHAKLEIAAITEVTAGILFER